MMMEDFGARVASVWEGLRPATRSLVERALHSAQTYAAPETTPARVPFGASYDARAEWELSRLLAALDDRAAEAGGLLLSGERARELVHIAETCALVLHKEARSAEVFAQLLARALRSHDFARVDRLADTIFARLAPSEMCELSRHDDPAVRSIAQEAMLQLPTSTLVELLDDPVDSGAARFALRGQAEEYESEEARWVINALAHADAEPDEA